MSDTHTQFIGSIPENYDRHLGPLFFEHYAADLARRIAVPDDAEVLETACGTGISTQFLRQALPESVRIIATDLNEPMLDYARERRGGLPNVIFEQANAQDLPFESGRFDAVLCQFGLMFLPDKAAGAREAARVLKPGGQYAFNVWDSFDENPIARVAHETIGTCFPEDPPKFLEVPFSYSARAPIEALLASAGFADIEISAVANSVERPSARDVATGFVKGNPAYLEIVERGSVTPEEVVDALADAFRANFGDAPMRTDIQAVVVTCRRPSEPSA